MANIVQTHSPIAVDERDLEQFESVALVPMGAATDHDVVAPDGPDQSMVTQSEQAPFEPGSSGPLASLSLNRPRKRHPGEIPACYADARSGSPYRSEALASYGRAASA
jgi:hypothetical protein